jgi:myosin heavy subunit
MDNYCRFRYTILSPNAVPQGFVDGKIVTEKVLAALQMDNNNYRLGHTKVFFRAGVLGELEDMRDERLTRIIAFLQAHIRGYLMRQNYSKLQNQRYAYIHLYNNETSFVFGIRPTQVSESESIRSSSK